HARGLLFRARPFVVDEFRGVEPGALLTVECRVRPRLVRMARQEHALGDAKARVVPRQRIHSRDRIAQRSGKMFCPSVVRRYDAPADPPVPWRVPIVRSTILTWR